MGEVPMRSRPQAPVLVCLWILIASTRASAAFLCIGGYNDATPQGMFERNAVPLPHTRQPTNRPTTTTPLHLTNNPNDSETPQQRRHRMDLVRSLQRSFYQNETGIQSTRPGQLVDVPLWRVQWTELPGYQNVLNVHVPHYTHMFMKVLSGPKPWYFGHVFLPGGSENLDNPKYFFFNGDDDGGSDDTTTTTTTDATVTGVLMQISDYEQLDDGRLFMVVQALERFRVLEARRHVPYAIATVELDMDEELVEGHLDRAVVAAAAAATASTSPVEPEDEDEDLERPGGSGGSMPDVWGAAQSAAAAESMQYHPMEFRTVTVEEVSRGTAVGASPLANYDGDVVVEVADVNRVVSEALEDHFRLQRQQQQPAVSSFSEPTKKRRRRRRDRTAGPSSQQSPQELETQVWLALDELLRLLTALNPNPDSVSVPIPTQLLGLVPSHPAGGGQWPEEFVLHTYARRMADNSDGATAMVGTMTKSPFVHIGARREYPELRRAQRLSYGIWLLIDSIVVGPGGGVADRQKVLEMGSVAERLEAVKGGLDAINRALRNATGRG